MKGAEEVVSGIGGSEMGILGIGIGMDSETVGIGGSVCVDMDTEEDGVQGKFVWVDSEIEEVVVVVGTVWVAMLIFDT